MGKNSIKLVFNFMYGVQGVFHSVETRWLVYFTFFCFVRCGELTTSNLIVSFVSCCTESCVLLRKTYSLPYSRNVPRRSKKETVKRNKKKKLPALPFLTPHRHQPIE